MSHPRISLDDASEGLKMSRTLKQTGFLAWRTLQGKKSQPCTFALKLNEQYREIMLDGQEKPNNDIFTMSDEVMKEIKKLLVRERRDTSREKMLELYSEFTIYTMCHLIFGSNETEKAGMSLDTTIALCHEIFTGIEVDAANIDPSSKECQDQVQKLVAAGVNDPQTEHVIRSRREVIQHAQALMHITNAALTRDDPMTEELILETHRILCKGLSLENGHGDHQDWAGTYRDTVVAAGSTIFCSPQDVPKEMERFIEDFNEDVWSSEQSKNIDPFFLAADVCQDFVVIHPFKDGNGRMCRLLAAAYMIKYAGIMISIGEHEQDRKEYLEMAILAGDPDREEEARARLATLFLRKSLDTLQRLREKLRNKA